ncbi:MAG: hypothetical protein P4M11_14875, partial [Candidatus Pacebacteria bacterium]|nr:hypothetical protein [Candidatus Paceibacterota bacterium]
MHSQSYFLTEESRYTKMPSSITGLVQKDFDACIFTCSLCFKEQFMEDAYISARLSLALISINTKRFLVLILAGYIIMFSLDFAAKQGYGTPYEANPLSWYFVAMCPVIVLIEAMCYQFRVFYPFRGIATTVLGCLVSFHNCLADQADHVFYPYIGCAYSFATYFLRPLMWSVAAIYMHMHYMRGWVVSLLTYVAVFIELTIMTVYYYGAHFWDQCVGRAFIDLTYYFVVFSWFSGCSVFAIRAHEVAERANFFSKYQQSLEIREWKRLMDDIPAPVIFARMGNIQFFNKATLQLLDIEATGATTSSSRSLTSFDSLRDDVAQRLVMLKDKNAKLSFKEILDSHWELHNDTLFVYKKSGEQKRLVSVKCVRTHDAGKEEEGVVEYIFHDVTALKALEQNKAKEKCFDLLLATVSHDIRTPLNVMLGVID